MQRNILVLDVDSCALAGNSLKLGQKADVVSKFVVDEVKKNGFLATNYDGFYIATHRTLSDLIIYRELLTSIEHIDAITNHVQKYPQTKLDYSDFSNFNRDDLFLSPFKNRLEEELGLPCFGVSTPGDGNEECGYFFNNYFKPYEQALIKSKETIVCTVGFDPAYNSVTTQYDFKAASVEFKNPIPIEKRLHGSLSKNDQYRKIAKDIVRKHPNDTINLIALDDQGPILASGMGIKDLPPNVTLEFYQHDSFNLYEASQQNKEIGSAFVYYGTVSAPVPKTVQEDKKLEEPTQIDRLSDTVGLDDENPNFETIIAGITKKYAAVEKVPLSGLDRLKQSILNSLEENYESLKNMLISEVEALFLQNIQKTGPVRTLQLFGSPPPTFDLDIEAIGGFFKRVSFSLGGAD